jgi:chaperone LolA
MIRFPDRLIPALVLAALLPACSPQAAPRASGDAQPAAQQRTTPAAGVRAAEPSMDAGADLPGTGQAPDAAAPAATPGGAASAPPVGTKLAEAPLNPAATGVSQDEAARILTRVERATTAVRSLEADFTQSLSVPLLNTNQTSRGKLYQHRPDRMAMRFTDPAGDVMVADGEYFWIYYPSTDPKQVIRTSIRGGAAGQVDLQQQFLGNPNSRFVATMAGDEAVAGRPAHVLTLVPKRRSSYRILKIWVDKQDFLVRRFEMTEENESIRRVELRNLRVNHAIPDAIFSFTPPPGAQVFDQ